MLTLTLASIADMHPTGWRKQMSYCIAFSADGCADVTRRYVRDISAVKPRDRCPENVLNHIIREIKALRRRDMDKKEKFRLMAEDTREDEEFRKYVIENIASQISKILPSDGASTNRRRDDPDAAKALESQQLRLDARFLNHGESRQGTPDQPRDQRGQ